MVVHSIKAVAKKYKDRKFIALEGIETEKNNLT
jgi:hypothetical protein